MTGLLRRPEYRTPRNDIKTFMIPDKIFETLSTDVEQNNIIAIEPAENISIINNSI